MTENSSEFGGLSQKQIAAIEAAIEKDLLAYVKEQRVIDELKRISGASS